LPGERIPTSRAARAAKVGRLAAGEAARHAGTHAANLARPPKARRAALERRHLETADQILTVLGTMKGAAMKFGQMLSFLDLGVVPKEARPEFQRKLAALRDSAPQVPFGRMMRVLEEDIGFLRRARSDGLIYHSAIMSIPTRSHPLRTLEPDKGKSDISFRSVGAEAPRPRRS
jgi:predicted unusual protein kinase regulating ubiquinone biosynthesis (AarF/ABC1/UbiB family)